MKGFSLRMFFTQNRLQSVILWLAICCAGLLVLSPGLLTAMRLNEIAIKYGMYAGIGLLISCAYILTRIVNYFLDEAICFLQDKREKEAIIEKIKLLDGSERALLREFFLQGETVLTLPQDEQAVKSLVTSNILALLGNQKHYAIQGPTSDYKISMRARGHLNRQVLRFPTGEPNKEEMDILLKSRPDFMNSLISPR
ncbi:superinfection exclusion B family protein [Shewanella surugensis]|uniref:Superinfection exclusion B family protein n=1 Tax=Shewanella surugensis TaxID=212020 RepID=A0ABT0LA28_9GAMM|nr:superinfection exclusion B family protein [Shewanella surugensis]MCL1124576.1 superinfection exclusion B family protein [Shewanella surugensis]